MLCLPFEISSTLNLFCVEMKKTEVRIWILDFVCYPTFEYLIGHKWRIQNTPPHIADFCQGIYQDQALRNLSKSWKFQSNVWTKEKHIRPKKPFPHKKFQFPWPSFSDIIKITQSPPAICFTIAPPQEYFEIFEIFLFQ